MTLRILIVEDEPPLAAMLERGLCEAGFEAEACASAEDAFVRLAESSFDLMLLDLNLPGRSGHDLLPLLRRLHPSLMVLVATARGALDDRVRALETGADDFLIKPFAFAELVARVHALARRGRSDTVLRPPDLPLEIDLVAHKVSAGPAAVDLTAREFDLLALLARHCGRPVTRDMLVRDLWRQPMRTPSLDNVIDVHIARLRQKLAAAGLADVLHTVRGVGFVLSRNVP